MKKIALVVVITTLILACKKDDKEAHLSIIGKWKPEKYISWYTARGPIVANLKDTFFSKPGEYSDFRNDGKIYYKRLEGNDFKYDTVRYSINNDKLILLRSSRDSIVYNIQMLTSNNLNLYRSDTTYISNGQISEYWLLYTK